MDEMFTGFGTWMFTIKFIIYCIVSGSLVMWFTVWFGKWVDKKVGND